ncbi:MAG: hypothetical protein HC932_00035 [Thermales bacterium]|nr:hypothetical protein [Thermales bacterium]
MKPDYPINKSGAYLMIDNCLTYTDLLSNKQLCENKVGDNPKLCADQNIANIYNTTCAVSNSSVLGNTYPSLLPLSGLILIIPLSLIAISRFLQKPKPFKTFSTNPPPNQQSRGVRRL